MLRYPVKAMLVPALCWSLLAGFGLDSWRSSRPPARVALVTGLLAALCLAAAWYALDPRGLRTLLLEGVPDSGAGPLGLGRRLLLSGGLALLASVLAALACRGWSPATTAAAVAVACCVDLVVAHRPLNPTVPHELLAFRPPVVQDMAVSDRSRTYVYDYSMVQGWSRKLLGRDEPYPLRRDPGVPLRLQQVLSQRLYPFPPSAARWGVEGSYERDVRGLYPSSLNRLSRLLVSVDGTPAQLRLLRLGAVSRVVSLHTRGLEDLIPLATRPSLFPEPVRVYSVPEPLPRAYAVGAALAAGDEEALALLQDPSFDPRQEILVPGVTTRQAPGFYGRCRIVELAPDRVALESDFGTPGFVVLVDSFDPGWRASVDGRPVPMLRANLAFRAVLAPAGRHAIEMVYRPRSVIAGLTISGCAVGLAAALALRRSGDSVRA
jgi:hypothetical protein